MPIFRVVPKVLDNDVAHLINGYVGGSADMRDLLGIQHVSNTHDIALAPQVLGLRRAGAIQVIPGIECSDVNVGSGGGGECQRDERWRPES
jgi:hypothetical protein